MNDHIRMLVMTCLLLVTVAAYGKSEKPPQGMGKYVIVLWEPGTDVPGGKTKRVAEPDVKQHGGRLLHSKDNRRIVFLPLQAARQVRKHEAVAYVQRIWTDGESLGAWDESSPSNHSRFELETDGTLNWGPKDYAYDGSGNITSIGGTAGDLYTYDTAGRLIEARVEGKTEQYEYDAFGNLLKKGVVGSNPVVIPIDSGSNRLAGTEYDVTGNVMRQARRRYDWDSAGMLWRTTSSSGGSRRILYDANDERIGTIIDTILSRWQIRDMDGQIIREYRGDRNGDELGWIWEQDHVRANGHLVAGETQSWQYNGSTTTTYGGARHYHLDHLGSVRMVTNAAGKSLSEHDYYPFGTTKTLTYQEQLNIGDPHVDAMRFAGHWRDFLGLLNAENTDYLDYMHARHYDPNQGRFLSVDQASGEPHDPQSWNRYSYSLNNPVLYIDPTGNKYKLFGFVNDADEQKFFQGLSDKTGLTVTNNNGVMDYARDASGQPVVATDANGNQLGSAIARADLIGGIDSTKQYNVQRVDGNSSVHMGVRAGSLIRLDFSDMGQINTGNNMSATFDSAMIFLHEGVAHAHLGLKDPNATILRQMPTAQGDAVVWENKIRTQLGLPHRSQYRFETDNNGKRYIPFARGRVMIP